jgi:hypothetical protein
VCLKVLVEMEVCSLCRPMEVSKLRSFFGQATMVEVRPAASPHACDVLRRAKVGTVLSVIALGTARVIPGQIAGLQTGETLLRLLARLVFGLLSWNLSVRRKSSCSNYVKHGILSLTLFSREGRS